MQLRHWWLLGLLVAVVVLGFPEMRNCIRNGGHVGGCIVGGAITGWIYLIIDVIGWIFFGLSEVSK